MTEFDNKVSRVMQFVVATCLCIWMAGSYCYQYIPSPSPEDYNEAAEQCDEAAENLRKLGCPEATLPDGTSFEEFCVDVSRNGAWINVPCLTTIDSCDEIESVCNRRP